MEKIIINTSQAQATYTSSDKTEKTIKVTSNESKTENLSVSFVKDKSSMFEYGAPKDEIQQNIILSNESLSEITNIRLLEEIGTGASFKQGSLTIDDVPYENMDITTGITLPMSINANSSALVSYMLVIDETPTVNSVDVKTKVIYDANEIKDMMEYTPTVTIDITENKITIDKTSDKSVVISGNTLLFQSVIKNVGKVKNTEVFFQDTLPDDVTFIPKSVKINKQTVQESYDPTVGFNLGELDIDGEIEVTFEVLVK